jgi:hypothetical protein
LLGRNLRLRSPSSHSSFCEEVFPVSITPPNEVERSNILAPGFRLRFVEAHLLPAFTPAGAGIGLGKSYPVTAAQLLPIHTGFLAPLHFLQTNKELIKK